MSDKKLHAIQSVLRASPESIDQLYTYIQNGGTADEFRRILADTTAYTVTEIGPNRWGVTDPGTDEPGHAFPTRRQALAFVLGRCLAAGTARRPTGGGMSADHGAQ